MRVFKLALNEMLLAKDGPNVSTLTRLLPMYEYLNCRWYSSPESDMPGVRLK